MKKVFSSGSEVIHLFAQQIQTEARSSNVYFEQSNFDKPYGDIIYSYGKHYMLGKFIDDNTILINDKGYSNTTSKHIKLLSEATTQYKQLRLTQTDTDLVSRQIYELTVLIGKARKPETYLYNIQTLWKTYLENKKYVILDVNTNEKKHKELEEIVQPFLVNTEETITKLKEEEKTRKAYFKLKRTRNIEHFKNYDIDTFTDKYCYLRISSSGKHVETSKDVKIPIAAAKILYQKILANENIVGYRIEHYKIDEWNDKFLVVRCHTIPIKEIQEIGEKII